MSHQNEKPADKKVNAEDEKKPKVDQAALDRSKEIKEQQIKNNEIVKK